MRGRLARQLTQAAVPARRPLTANCNGTALHHRARAAGRSGQRVRLRSRAQRTTSPRDQRRSREAAGCGSPEHPRRRGRRIPAAVRRAVFERDQSRCAYLDDSGQRCRETHHLELHHLKPYTMGGEHTLANLALRCRAHNALARPSTNSARISSTRRASRPDTSRSDVKADHRSRSHRAKEKVEPPGSEPGAITPLIDEASAPTRAHRTSTWISDGAGAGTLDGFGTFVAIEYATPAPSSVIAIATTIGTLMPPRTLGSFTYRRGPRESSGSRRKGEAGTAPGVRPGSARSDPGNAD